MHFTECKRSIIQSDYDGIQTTSQCRSLHIQLYFNVLMHLTIKKTGKYSFNPFVMKLKWILFKNESEDKTLMPWLCVLKFILHHLTKKANWKWRVVEVKDERYPAKHHRMIISDNSKYQTISFLLPLALSEKDILKTWTTFNQTWCSPDYLKMSIFFTIINFHFIQTSIYLISSIACRINYSFHTILKDINIFAGQHKWHNHSLKQIWILFA